MEIGDNHCDSLFYFLYLWIASIAVRGCPNTCQKDSDIGTLGKKGILLFAEVGTPWPMVNRGRLVTAAALSLL